jgi:hypothetical protein
MLARWLMRAIVAAVIGAVATIAVSWALAAKRQGQWMPRVTWDGRYGWPEPEPASWPQTCRTVEGYREMEDAAFEALADLDEARQVAAASAAPAPSRAHWHDPRSGGFVPLTTDLGLMWLAPTWPGFALDMAIYGAAWLVLLAVWRGTRRTYPDVVHERRVPRVRKAQPAGERRGRRDSKTPHPASPRFGGRGVRRRSPLFTHTGPTRAARRSGPRCRPRRRR